MEAHMKRDIATSEIKAGIAMANAPRHHDAAFDVFPAVRHTGRRFYFHCFGRNFVAKTSRTKTSDTLGVGIIGAGGIARGIHIPGYQKLENARVVAIAEPVEESRNATGEEFGIENSYADYREMLARDDIDAVSITTPNFLHAQATIDALNAGKHVLCEKPLAMNAKEGAKMVAAATKNNRKLMCGYNHRFRPEIQTLKKFADDGALGKVYYARSQALRRRGIPGWGLFISREKNGGGPLIDIGVHILDATLHILGFPKPISVSGKTYQMFGKRSDVVGLMGQWDYKNFTVEDFAVAQIRFENDLVLTLESSFCANIAQSDVFNFQILGDKGGCTLDPLQLNTEKDKTLLDVTPAFLPKNVQSHHAEIASFVDSILNDKPVFTPGEEALQVTRIIDAIYQSSEKGREVKL
jgi:predicted dehydrogenase